MKSFRLQIAAVAVIGLLCVISPANASLIGTIAFNNDVGGGVTVSNTFIDWRPPLGSGYGNFATGLNTDYTYNDTPTTTVHVTDAAPVYGRIADLTINLAAPSPFIQFYSGSTSSSLLAVPTFDLTGFSSPFSDPSVLHGCSTVTASSASASCAPVNASFPGGYSPFLLKWDSQSQSTSVILGVFMAGHDASATTVDWSGGFTTQLNRTSGAPSTVETTLNSGGTISNTYSATFSGSSVPEPATMLLIGSGLLLVGVVKRPLLRRK